MTVKRTIALALALAACIAGCSRYPRTQTSAPTTEPTHPETTESAFGMTTEPSKETTAPSALPTAVTTEPPPVEPENDDFVRVLDYIPNARQALAYATTDNFTGQVIYEFTDAYLRCGTVKKLAEVAAELEEQGLGLLIWDGYRPVYA